MTNSNSGSDQYNHLQHHNAAIQQNSAEHALDASKTNGSGPPPSEHPNCPRCDGELAVKRVYVSRRRDLRIGGARVYKCQVCHRTIVLKRSDGGRAYHLAWLRDAERESGGKAPQWSAAAERLEEAVFGDLNGSAQ